MPPALRSSEDGFNARDRDVAFPDIFDSDTFFKADLNAEGRSHTALRYFSVV
jgi:hypothetical protein